MSKLYIIQISPFMFQEIKKYEFGMSILYYY